MHSSVFLNQGLLGSNEPQLPAISSAGFYGKGIFTTIRIHGEAPFLWDKHWRRLEKNSVRTGIDLAGFTQDSTRTALDELLVANAVHTGRARITFFDTSSGEMWNSGASDRGTSMLITTADLRSPAEKLSICVSRYGVNSSSPLASVKSCNYLEKTMALEDAKRRGFDDAVQLNERGEITSACMANIFWVKDGELFTPSLNTGCLAGTTREFILENLECAEVEEAVGELDRAEEIFLTSAGIGIVQVAEFNGRALRGEQHTMTTLLPNSK